MAERINFASDNTAGAHPKIMDAIVASNEGRAPSYGEDALTEGARRKIRELFGGPEDMRVYFVLTGTAANVLSLKCLLRSHEAVLHSPVAHIHTDEGGAPEAFVGCKCVPCPFGKDGKIGPGEIEPFLAARGNPHHSQPRVISIAQSTEQGTVYTPEEVRALADFAHARGMYLHMDGARLANAAASLGAPLRSFTLDAGVDVWTFGGTKNGLLIGEAVLFADSSIAEAFPYVRKQGMQLYAKMRFIGAQFLAYLRDNLWLENARRANSAADRLAEGLKGVPSVTLLHPVQANGVFARWPAGLTRELDRDFSFYVLASADGWDEVRLMTSFATAPAEVDALLSSIRARAGLPEEKR